MTKIFSGLIPLACGLIFAAGMFFLAFSLTERSREHYQKKLQWSKVDFSSIINIGGDSKPKSEREKTLSETIGFYEIQFPIIALPLFFFGFGLSKIALGILPERNPLGLSDFARRGCLGMVCLILLSTGIFLMYIWTLRVGLL